MKEINFTPVKKILNAINSCQSAEEISKCKDEVDSYIESTGKAIVNKDDLKTRLYNEIDQRQEALYLTRIFI